VKRELAQLIAGEVPYILAGCDQLPADPLLFPGSFNPFPFLSGTRPYFYKLYFSAKP